MTARHPKGIRLVKIVEAVRSSVPKFAARDEPFFEAAVALVLRPTSDDDIELLFIQRTARDDDPWSGQIALPGGRRDARDDSLEDTVVRETKEEVALDLRLHGTIVGLLDELRPRTPLLPHVIVRPFVATISATAPVDPSSEVAAFFWAPLDAVLDPSATRETEILARGVRTRQPAIHFQQHVIWGMTERMLVNLGQLLA